MLLSCLLGVTDKRLKYPVRTNCRIIKLIIRAYCGKSIYAGRFFKMKFICLFGCVLTEMS